MYSKLDIEKVNELPILQVAERLGIQMKRRGATVMAPCLWHDDHSPSMQVGGKMNTCHCYVCQQSHGVIDLVMEHEGMDFKCAMDWLNHNFLGGILGSSKGFKCQVPKVASSEGLQVEKVKKVYGTIDDARRFVNLNNALSRCLLHYFDREVVEKVTYDYLLGNDEEVCHFDHTLFPSIDIHGQCHNIKVQGYCTNPNHERFCHSNRKETYWVGQRLQEAGRWKRDADLDTNCVFGEHLLQPPSASQQVNESTGQQVNESAQRVRRTDASLRRGRRTGQQVNEQTPQPPIGGDCIGVDESTRQKAIIVLVESPKNAIVGACWKPEMTWVAVGNKGMLKREVLEVLRGQQVLVIPDRDATEEWRNILQGVGDIAQFHVSSFCQCQDDPENKKMDIADWVLKDRFYSFAFD